MPSIINQNLSDTLELISEFEGATYIILKDKLTIVSTFDSEVAKQLTDTLDITDSFTPEFSPIRDLSDTLTLTNVFNPSIYSPTYVNTPIPNTTTISTPSNDAQINTTPGPLVINHNSVPTTVTFLHGTHSLTLPAPEYGNNDNYKEKRINRTSRGGSRIIHRDNEQWSYVDEFTLTFNRLTLKDILNLKEFMNRTVGLKITFTDYLGIIHYGIITNPEAGITETDRTGYTVQINFQESPISDA